ncbi:energy transducer TonB [Rhodanobacter denitrificans]|uniref:Protein TonB n=1 Tax=Rhodanobacter denitrificans TaxID=666685 RepID=A0A368KI02_9GAMM|nr:energy transducer TonB [Rhodanobacter denitrificans]RCS31487.1 energy transducer TonB [Rhodanobacter denitrificans]
MDTRYTLDVRRHARGAAKPMLIAIISIFALLAVGAWFLIIKPHQELIMADSGGHPSTPVSTTTRVAAAPPANVAVMDIDQLLAEARTAMNEQRYLAPAGNNAFEYYLRVLQKEPGNKVASDALRETFPFAATSAEQSINSRDFNEAQRQIDLLAKADAANFTLTILRSKLDAQRKTVDKQQQLAQEQQKAAAQVAAQKAAADKQAEQLAEQQKTQVAAQKAEASRAAQPSRQAAASQSAPADGSVASSEGGDTAQTSAAVLVKGASARYPTSAMRARQEGWVVVSFTVEADGKTSDVKVVESQPRHVFDRAAMDAVERYQFTPAMRSGVAVSSTKQQRIEFKL